jgi:hypothetical protein
MKKALTKVLGLVFVLSLKILFCVGQEPNETPMEVNSILQFSGMDALNHPVISRKIVESSKTIINSSPGIQTGGETYSISATGVRISSTPIPSAVSTLTINLNYASDATFTSAGLSAADIINMKAANVYAAQQFTNNYTDPINVNIDVTAVPGTTTLGGSSTSIFFTPFATIVSATTSDATTPDDAVATGVGGSIASTLTDPVGGTHNWLVSKAQRKALGIAADDLTRDGTYTFGGGFSYTYDPNNRAVAGKIDYIGVSMHEFSEIMGRIPGLGGTISGNPGYLQFDLFHYTGAATRGLTNGAGRFFSINGGTTLLKAFNFPNGNGSDPQDWASGTNDCFNAFSSSGVLNALSAVDIRNMDVIGYNFAPSCTPPTITCPANITVNNTPGLCGANVTYPPATATGDPAPTITYSKASGSFFIVGNTTVTATATNSCGTASCTFTVRVVDNQLPSISCAANISVNNDAGICGAVVTYTTPVGTDNCASTTLQTTGLASGSQFPVGTTINTFVVRDASNNTATCSFTVTVTDNEPPVITAPPVFSCYEADNFGCSINLGASATDNCSILSLTSNAPACFPVGTTTVTWTATDVNGNVSTKTQTVTRNPEINVSICAAITRTIYIGTYAGVGPFGPQSINLSSTASGGTPGYTYSWSPTTGLNTPNIANPVASPTITTTYVLTVTDSKGCTRSLGITINVLPLSAAVCAQNGNSVKFNVCHIPPGNPSNSNNICISSNALPAHLNPGTNGHNNCTLGPCGQQLCFSTLPTTQAIVVAPAKVNEVMIADAADGFKVIAYPNPSAGDFRIQVNSYSDEPVTVRILDVTGAIRSVSLTNAKTNIIKVGADLPSGTYTAEIIQGTKRQMIKLVKLK